MSTSTLSAAVPPVLGDAAMFLSSLSGFTSIAVMVLGLCLLITIHELGHWFVARLFGFKTPVFSIGFGPRKWSIVLGKFWDTEFRLAPILAGGYVSIPELQDETTARELLKDDPDAGKDLKVFPVWQRICVAAAGVVFNVVSAVIMLFALFAFIGEPGYNVRNTYIKDVSTTQVTIARDAGLQANDQVVSVAGGKIVTPEDLTKAIQANKGVPVEVVVTRGPNNDKVAISLTPDAAGKIGIAIGVNGEQVFNPVSVGKAASDATTITGNMITMTFKGFGMMLGIVDKPVGVSDQDMEVRGIVGIVQMGADAVNQGVFNFVWFLVAISINLAVMNILPLPILDGGHIVFFLIEKVRGGKPVDAKLKGRLYSIFGALLIGLMVYGLFNDMVHIFGR